MSSSEYRVLYAYHAHEPPKKSPPKTQPTTHRMILLRSFCLNPIHGVAIPNVQSNRSTDFNKNGSGWRMNNDTTFALNSKPTLRRLGEATIMATLACGLLAAANTSDPVDQPAAALDKGIPPARQRAS